MLWNDGQLYNAYYRGSHVPKEVLVRHCEEGNRVEKVSVEMTDYEAYTRQTL